MIGFLRGRLAGVEGGAVLVDVGGVGYRLLVPVPTLGRLPQPGQEVMLQTSMQVREDSITLYGFHSGEEKAAFEHLLSVSGIGPRLALAVLSALGAHGLAAAVATGDPATLARVPGIGKKTAGRLILELKDRLAPPGGDKAADGRQAAAQVGDAFAEAAAALQSLGYSGSEAMQAVDRVRRQMEPGTPVEEIVRRVLQAMGGGDG